MLQGYTHTQALRLYRKYGVRVAVPLSTAAVRIARTRASSKAGLAELSLISDPYMVRASYQSDAEFHAELLAMRAAVHNATLQLEHNMQHA